MEEEEKQENNEKIDKIVMEPGKFDKEEPLKGSDRKTKVERRADDAPAKSARENVTKNEEDGHQKFPYDQYGWDSRGIMEIELDIENMTLNEYWSMKLRRKGNYGIIFDPEEVQQITMR
nr:hypothetical protein [Tanacetum cinerariifolium]